MALDIYVGPMARYYAGQWKPILLQWAEAGRDPEKRLRIERSGELEPLETIEAHLVVSHLPGQSARTLLRSGDGELFEAIEVKSSRRVIAPPALASARVDAWVAAVNEWLTTVGRSPVEWAEGLDGAYSTDKPGWTSYEALLLWAAHDEHRDLPLPKTVDHSLDDDLAYKRSTAPEFEGMYSSLLGVEIWLPGPVNLSFGTVDPAGVRRRVAFVPTLLLELYDLNDRTWKASMEEIASWSRDAPPVGVTLESHAKFAYSILLRLAQTAMTDRLPMLLDY